MGENRIDSSTVRLGKAVEHGEAKVFIRGDAACCDILVMACMQGD